MSAKKLEHEALREFIGFVDVGGGIADRVRAVMADELTDRQRQMVEMYYTDQMNMPEIAVHLGVSPSSVSRTIMRGRKRIRKYLKYNGRAFSRSFDD